MLLAGPTSMTHLLSGICGSPRHSASEAGVEPGAGTMVVKLCAMLVGFARSMRLFRVGADLP